MSVDDLGLYANRNEYRDFVHNAIQRLSADGCNIYIAVAFFTEANVVEDLLVKGCRTRLVVRLGFPTSPDALQRLMGKSGVEIRYFTGHAFHPKVYIFGNKAALVGSANLTRSAILTNQEVVVSIDSNDPRLTELASLFGDYWNEAKVLDPQALDKYRVIFQQFEKLQGAADKLGQDVLDKLGTSQPSNITRDKVKASRESLFLEDFRKTYQECVSAFNIVREAYLESGYRKADSAAIPLRIEIDSFISFVRERKAEGESWMSSPLRSAAEQRQVIAGLIEEWRSTTWPHFEEKIVGENYPRLLRTFKSESSVMAASDDELFDALSTLHSFYDRFRFYLGGLPTWKKTFLAANEPTRVRETLAYLVFGKDKIESRMANAIYDSRFKLNAFGQANVQELIGWVNREELPIINGRTTKVLRFFGSDVRQL
jgi:HKD family nuclease